jgi:poly(3-hydroxybutyrate) depolymerase
MVLFLLLSLPFSLFSCTTPSEMQETETEAEGTDTTQNTPPDSSEEKTLSQQIEEAYANLTDSQSISNLRELVWQEYVESVSASEPERKSEIKKNRTTKITIGKTTMKVQTKVIGQAPDDGYPVFLVYHGGGYDPTGTTNESQWSGMATRYTATGVAGIYISIRSVSDNESSGQIFSTDISWKFYDRIIEDCILYMNANPNQCYIVGYSAGGNGVYQIAPILADRLAAATMTAGHPEGVDLTNLYNLPFYLNVGELDPAYNRNTITVEYSKKLDQLAETYGGGYIHECFVHVGKEHGVVGDNATSAQTVVKDLDSWYSAYKASGTLASTTGNTTSAITDAATLMTAWTRDPLPTRVVWNTSTTKSSQRGINSFYWLSTDTQSGIVDVSYDKSTNTITIASNKLKKGNLTIYLNEGMVDLFSDITVVFPNGKTVTVRPEIDLELLRTTTAERGDSNYQFCASITISGNSVK